MRGGDAGKHLNEALQITALDLPFRECRFEICDLAQWHHAWTAVRVQRGCWHKKFIEISYCGAVIARQAYQYLMIFAVRAFPLACVFARNHGPRSAHDRGHGYAQVTCQLAIDNNIERGARRFVG